MRRIIAVFVTAMSAIVLAVGTVAGAGQLWKAPPFSSIGINNIYFIGNTFAEGGSDGTVLRVWVDTGSSTERCLATLGEAYTASGDGVGVEQLYCSSRQPTLADGTAHWGLMITLALAAPLPDGSWYSVNIYQEGAQRYGTPTPISCDDQGCSLTS